MNVRKSLRQSCCLIGLYLSMTCMAWAQVVQGRLVDKIIAHVDNQIILQSELETAFQQYLAQSGEEDPNLKCEILEQLIINKLLLAKAKQEGVVVEKEVIARELTNKMALLSAEAGSEAALAKYWGKPITVIKSEVREKIEEQLILDNMFTQRIKDISVTPKEVKAFFEALPDQKKPYYPTEAVVRQIVQYPQKSKEAIAALVAQLNGLKMRLQNGEDFADLAKAYSQDPGSAHRGGSLGFWRFGELMPAYEAAVLTLQPGEISDPVITELGCHLIQLIAREKDKYNSRHILLKPKFDIEVTKKQLAQLREDILVGKMTFQQAAKKNSEDSLTNSSGGLLTGENGGESMTMVDFPPDVFFAIEHLKPGEITEPIVFTTPDDQEAVRILLLEARIEPHQANLMQDYAKIKQLLIDEQRINALKTWFEGLKSTASISVAPEYQHCELLK